MKFAIIAITCVLFCSTAHAQLEKIIHKTFELNDSVDQISLDLSGEYSIEKWAGDMILAETTVQLYGAGKNVMKYFVDQGRYDINGAEASKNFALVSKDKRELPIRTQRGSCNEIVNIRLLVPEEFQIVSSALLQRERKVQEIPTTSTQGKQ